MKNADVFISYKSEEQEKAEQFRTVLEKNGISCWMAPTSIPGGSNYAMEIPKAIRNCKIFVVLLSNRSQQSKWVRKELDRAINNGKIVFPVMLEDCPLCDPFDFYLTDVQRYNAYLKTEETLRSIIERILSILSGVSVQKSAPTREKKNMLQWFFGKKKVQKMPDITVNSQEFKVPEPAYPSCGNVFLGRFPAGHMIADRYEIIKEIGKGGTSEIYLATDKTLDIPVAIKRMRSDHFVDFASAKQVLKQEFELQKRCVHSNISIIRDSVETDTEFMVILDHIDGKTIMEQVRENGPLDEKTAVSAVLQVCDALHYLHTREKPVYFRDVKPSNVMCKENGEVILIDFGAAVEETEVNLWDTTALGTYGFAAPEQYGGAIDGRTDVFGLGVTLYYALTGLNPAEPPFEVLPVRQVVPQLSEGVEQIILKAVQPNPLKRFQTIAEMRAALEKI